MKNRRTVLISGGSSGIGYTISLHFAAAAYRLLWVAKSETELQQAKTQLLALHPDTRLHTLALDLSQAEAPPAVYEWARAYGFIDVIINNAGFGTYGYLQDIPQARELEMLQVNVVAVYRLTRLFLDDMLKKDEGTIINISSNSSFQPVARMNTYASTKAFITHFSRGLQEELRLQGSKVRVLTVCPSAVQDTPFSKDMRNVRTFSGIAYTTAAEVGKDVWRAYQKQKTFLVTGKKMRFLYAIRRWVPYALQQYLTRKETERVSS